MDEEESTSSHHLYRVVHENDANGASLQRDHTHFVLVDTPDPDQWGSEIPFRAAFEQHLRDEFSVPTVIVIIEGGLKYGRRRPRADRTSTAYGQLTDATLPPGR